MLRTSREILDNRLEVLRSRKRALEAQLQDAESALVSAKDRYDSLAHHWQSAGRESALSFEDRQAASRRIRSNWSKSFIFGFALPLTFALLALLAR
jgi:chromosome segregation ATPase